jgi:hypothetical protein
MTPKKRIVLQQHHWQPGDLDVIRAMMDKYQWGEAQKLLTHYLNDHPDDQRALFLLGRSSAWLPHPGGFHDMRVWLRLPPGWEGLASGERPLAPPRCDAAGCLCGPYVGTGQPGAMLLLTRPRGFFNPARGALLVEDGEVALSPDVPHQASLRIDLPDAPSRGIAASFGGERIVAFENCVSSEESCARACATLASAVSTAASARACSVNGPAATERNRACAGDTSSGGVRARAMSSWRRWPAG